MSASKPDRPAAAPVAACKAIARSAVIFGSPLDLPNTVSGDGKPSVVRGTESEDRMSVHVTS